MEGFRWLCHLRAGTWFFYKPRCNFVFASGLFYQYNPPEWEPDKKRRQNEEN